MKQGLSAEEVQQRQQAYGLNIIERTRKFSVAALLFSQFVSFINGILFLAAIFFFLTRDMLDAVFILAVIVINALFGFFQEYRAEKSIEKLRSYAQPLCRVIRDGREQEIASTGLVPGDIVVLTEGDRIPADGTVQGEHNFEVDESILTGESLPVAKDNDGTVYAGTLVTKGKGTLNVLSTGRKTKFGQIAETLESITPEQTPLQKQLVSLGRILSVSAIAIALLLVPIEVAQGKELIPILLIAISIGIAAIPEGLPAVITIALALGANRMAKRNAIVRKMPAIETLGAVQVIITDKTGTLTQNVMRVKKHYTPHPSLLPGMLQASILGNTASLLTTADGKPDISGDPTDGALLVWAKNHHVPIQELIAEGTIVDEHVFDSRYKTVTTVWQKDQKEHVFVRGAPEVILKKSRLTDIQRAHMTREHESLAKEGLRVIGFGLKTVSSHEKNSRDALESGLTFAGFVGIYDPPRPKAAKAMRDAKNAGIHVIMVTGDSEHTALAIAQDIGLVEGNEDIITGDEIDRLTDAELSAVLKHTRIFARAKPQDKLRLVDLLMKQGVVVGVTGDGVNDALALKRADVGVAMGEKGTEVAKEASDIVLADDNFATLITAVEEGRTVYHNITKAIVYLLSGNLLQILLVFLAAVFGLPSPLLPTQILWINLVTDGLPALALAADRKDPGILGHKPRNPAERILNMQRLWIIAIVGGVSALFLFLAYTFLLAAFPEIQARTAIFNLLVFARLLLAFVVRGQSPFRVNRFLLVSVMLALGLQMLITLHPFFQSLLHLGIQ